MTKQRTIAIEQRAAELATWFVYGAKRKKARYYTPQQKMGWHRHINGETPVTDGEWAGWLAREIWLAWQEDER